MRNANITIKMALRIDIDQRNDLGAVRYYFWNLSRGAYRRVGGASEARRRRVEARLVTPEKSTPLTQCSFYIVHYLLNLRKK